MADLPQKIITYAPREATVTLPVRMEMEFMLDQRRLMKQLNLLAIASLGEPTEDQRQDSPGLEQFLQMNAGEILNERKLRVRLRHLATTLSGQKLVELRALLGRAVSAPAPGLIDAWIDSQVLAIQASVQQWLATSTAKIASSQIAKTPLATMVSELSTVSKSLAARAEKRASFAVLQLNSQIIEEVAKGAGSSHYRWITEGDSLVRDNHIPLDGTIQSWASPPSGGGTREGDIGAPGSGYGCRCVPEPIPTGTVVSL
jgi:hypothetical protein